MVVQVELREHRDNSPPALPEARCSHELPASYSMLQPQKSELLADGFGRARWNCTGQAQETGTPLNPSPLASVVARMSGLARRLARPQLTRGGVRGRFETSSLASALPPPGRAISACFPSSLLDDQPDPRGRQAGGYRGHAPSGTR